MGLSTEAASRFAADWFAAWNAHDLVAIMAHYADTVAYASPFVARLGIHPRGVLHGRAAVSGYFARALATYPDLQFTPIQLFSGVDSLVLLYQSVHNLLAAEAFSFDAAGRVASVRCHYHAPESALN